MSLELALLQGTWHLPLLFLMLGIAALYMVMLRRETAIKPYNRQPLLFYSMLGLIYLMIGTPISAVIHLSFSLHMLQMSLMYFIIPPMLMLSIPKTFMIRLPASWNKLPTSLFRVALLAFAVLFLLYHLPPVMQLLASFDYGQHVYSIILFLLALVMWTPMTWPDPAKRMSKAAMKRYASRSGLIIMPACVLFIAIAFWPDSGSPQTANTTANLCLPSQTSVSLLPAPFNTTYDQVTAGALMMGMHKASLVLTLRLHRKQQIQQPEN